MIFNNKTITSYSFLKMHTPNIQKSKKTMHFLKLKKEKSKKVTWMPF